MILFPEIDKKKTKKNASHVLNKYYKLIRIIGIKEAPVITSEYFLEMRTDLEQVLNRDNCFNNRKILAEKELAKIVLAINQLDEIDRQLLYDKYMNKNYTTNIAIYMKYHMSESKFYCELDNVLVKFAESYDDGVLLVEK